MRPAWMMCSLLSYFHVYVYFLSSAAAQPVVLDTFKDVSVNGCTCTFTMVLNDDGIVDEKNPACNRKCTSKSMQVTLGGPPSVSNVYQIKMKVARGSVTVVKLAATLVCPAQATTTTTMTEGPETSPAPGPFFRPKSGQFCDRFVTECLDGSSFPNIGQAFRGYNLILGDPLNYGGDPGFKGHIFDEAGERNGLVRFGNTAGNDLNRCDGSVRADFIETSEEFLESIMRSENSRKTFQIGSEVELTGNLGANAGAHANAGCDGICPVEVGVEGGVEGGVQATVTLPPLYQSVSSNSQVMAELSEGLESNQISITRSSFSCYEYDFEITEFQHPVFTGQFISAVAWLESCLLSGPPFQGEPAKNSSVINGTTAVQDECAIKFFQNYGTHYIKAARFGSKMSVLTVLDSKAAYSANKDEVAKCATKSKQWSLLGIIGGGSSKDTCMEDLFTSISGSAEGVLNDIVVTVGSRPKADYSEWADQQGKPEVIHKTIAPISDLFTKDFMTDIAFKENGDATIKELLETYLIYYCGLFRSQCNYVVARPYCPQHHCNGTSIGQGKCGHYTGSVDLNFLPHGHGTLTLQDEVARMIWIHGCTADCVVHPHGAMPGGYHFASEDEVTGHKDWILDTLEKWAVAKFETGYVYGRGYGGQIITEVTEVEFKHMVVCKTEVVITTPAPSTAPPIKTFSFYNERREWVEAVQYCTDKGQRLAIISTNSELQRAQSVVTAKNKDVWLAGNDKTYEGDWKWANGTLDDAWDTFINAGGSVGLDFAWKDGYPHVDDNEDCLFMDYHNGGEFDDEKCHHDKYVLCDDGTN